MTRNIKNKSKLHIFGLNIIYEQHNGNLTLNCVLGRTKANRQQQRQWGKSEEYFGCDTFVFGLGRCFRFRQPSPPVYPFELHIFGNTNFGIFNEFQVVVSVIANSPCPAPSPSPSQGCFIFLCALKSMQCLLCQPKSVPCPASCILACLWLWSPHLS